MNENLSFPLEVRGMGKDEREAKVKHALDMVQMGEFGNRCPAQLSGGQQQRIACAIRRDRAENPIFVEPDSCADIHTDISLKYAHIYNDFAHLNYIDDLLAQQGDLFS